MRPKPKLLFKDYLEEAELEFFYHIVPDGWWNGDRVLLESDRREHLLKGDEADIEKIARKLDALHVDYETSSGGIENRRDPGEMEQEWEELHIPRDKFRRNKVVIRLARKMEADVYDPDTKLRASLQKLANDNPEMRKHLRPLLEKQATKYIIRGGFINDSLAGKVVMLRMGAGAEDVPDLKGWTITRFQNSGGVISLVLRGR